MANYDFKNFEKRTSEIEEWFKSEIALLRTGRATPALVENVLVDYYGSKSPLKSVGSISTEDARTLVVKPWDTDSIMPIEQALGAANLGVQTITEKDMVRVIFPELNEERRTSLLKILKEKLEEGRVSLRREREDVWDDIQEKEKKGEMSEDDKFRLKDDLQKRVDDVSKKLEEIAKNKENEIRS